MGTKSTTSVVEGIENKLDAINKDVQSGGISAKQLDDYKEFINKTDKKYRTELVVNNKLTRLYELQSIVYYLDGDKQRAFDILVDAKVEMDTNEDFYSKAAQDMFTEFIEAIKQRKKTRMLRGSSHSGFLILMSLRIIVLPVIYLLLMLFSLPNYQDLNDSYPLFIFRAMLSVLLILLASVYIVNWSNYFNRKKNTIVVIRNLLFIELFLYLAPLAIISRVRSIYEAGLFLLFVIVLQILAIIYWNTSKRVKLTFNK